jgi:hypothetical protein
MTSKQTLAVDFVDRAFPVVGVDLESYQATVNDVRRRSGEILALAGADEFGKEEADKIVEVVYRGVDDEAKASIFQALQFMEATPAGFDATLKAFGQAYGVATDEHTARLVWGLEVIARSALNTLQDLGHVVSNYLGALAQGGQPAFIALYGENQFRFDDEGNIVDGTKVETDDGLVTV